MTDSLVPGTTRSLAVVLSRMRTAGLVGGSTTDTSSIAAARAAWRGYVDRSSGTPVLVDETPPSEAEIVAEAEAWEAELTAAAQDDSDDAAARADLADSNVLSIVRASASGSGAFANNAQRDAVIRANSRTILALFRLARRL